MLRIALVFGAGFVAGLATMLGLLVVEEYREEREQERRAATSPHPASEW